MESIALPQLPIPSFQTRRNRGPWIVLIMPRSSPVRSRSEPWKRTNHWPWNPSSFFTDETSKGWGRTSLDALWSPKTLHPSHNGKKSYDVSWELCLCFEPGEKRIVSYVRVRNAYLGLQQQVPTENGHRVEQVLCVCPCSSLSSKLVSFPFDSVLSEAFFLEQKAEQKIYSLEKRLEDGRENPSLSIKV
jgi:hypothetical protein